jgi:hypothetical protein
MFELYYNNDHCNIYQKNINNTYSYNISETELYIFEIQLEQFNDKPKTIRKILNAKSGYLISLDDNINYDLIKNISLTAIYSNNLNKEIKININLDHNLNTTKFINKYIYIEFIKNNINILECNYIIQKY